MRELVEYDWGKGQYSDQIGWMVPAVPDQEGLGFWGCTSTPMDGYAWWQKLPTLPEAK
jgi:hypothetical protein